jgi:hypothetical protein
MAYPNPEHDNYTVTFEYNNNSRAEIETPGKAGVTHLVYCWHRATR